MEGNTLAVNCPPGKVYRAVYDRRGGAVMKCARPERMPVCAPGTVVHRGDNGQLYCDVANVGTTTSTVQSWTVVPAVYTPWYRQPDVWFAIDFACLFAAMFCALFAVWLEHRGRQRCTLTEPHDIHRSSCGCRWYFVETCPKHKKEPPCDAG